MIGSETLAREVYNLHHARSASGMWNRIGQGCYRTAYLNVMDNLVYKVGTRYANETEFENTSRLLDRLLDVPPIDINVRIPRAAHFDGLCNRQLESVIVQEYAADCVYTNCASEFAQPCDCNRSYCYTDIIGELSRWSSLYDLHSENVLHNVKNDIFWIIDLGG